jgi:hypothetical protein
MIYTRFNVPTKILAQCGKQTSSHFRVGVHLARVEFNYVDEAPKVGYQFIEFLKADNGWAEICETYDAAPKIELEGQELMNAIGEAL